MGSGGQISRSQDDEVSYGGLVEALFSTLLGRVGILHSGSRPT